MPGVDLKRISLIRDRLQRGGTPGSGRLCDEGETILELRPRFKQGMPGESPSGAAAAEDVEGKGSWGFLRNHFPLLELSDRLGGELVFKFVSVKDHLVWKSHEGSVARITVE
jgi:hypothetical protein